MVPSVLERLRTALAPGIAVEREIAAGGMGTVYLGHDTVLDRPVAIKVLRPELTTAVAAERFLREARHAAGLRHPNVVQVHHAGEVDGLLYYTMDYVEGETLAARLARGRLAPRQVIGLGRDLLAALGAAHARGLIHRDVKPLNVFCQGERVLLGDFGVAYALDTDLTTLTRTGSPVGTLAYISPEQLHGGPITPRTDIYATGLVLYEAVTGRRWPPLSPPDKGDWESVPPSLRDPIRRALQLEPADRWPDADTFAAALEAVPPEGVARKTSRVLTAAAVVLVGLLILKVAPWQATEGQSSVNPDLAVFPFATAGLADSSIGARLAGLTGWAFERVEGFTVAPRQVAFRAWRSSSLSTSERLATLTGSRLRSRYGLWAVVQGRGPLLDVRLQVVDQLGAPIFQGSVTGDSTDAIALSDSVASTVLRAVFSWSRPRFRQTDALSRVPLPALTEFLLGEEAFARDAGLTAERHYLRAFRLDTTFVLAGWRLGNTRRWMPLREDPPYPPGLYALFQANRDAVAEVDRYLIEAQFRPSGNPRFEYYERALRIAGDDPYPALLYGDELFHRGPLAGRTLEDAVKVLQRAVAADSTLAPAWEHLAWAFLRLGDGTRAGEAVTRMERLAGRPEESEIYLPTFLRMAYDLRFGSPAAAAAVRTALEQSPSALALAARGALTADLPEAQVALGSALAASGEAGRRGSGLVARGVALVALGRPAEALASFDSATVLFPRREEFRLQAAEWRVVPAAVGLPGIADSERARGRSDLGQLAGDSVFGSRAAWALALDAHARGDTAAARGWTDRVSAATGGHILEPLLAAMEHAGAGRWDAALEASAPALAYDSAGYAPDPFLRAALHLSRGEWLARLGRTADADRAWLWYENLDTRGWPTAEAQPAEVDWALGTYARSRRARLGLERSGAPGREACSHARRVAELWSGAEPAAAAAARELETLAQRCRR